MQEEVEVDDVARPCFEDLYRRWYAPVVSLCRRRLGAQRDAETIAQEAFIRAWQSWARFSPDQPFGPWVWTIAHRLCLNEAKTAGRREEVPFAPRWAAVANADDLLDRALGRHRVRSALRLLSPRYRRVLCLRDIGGWSYEEIARLDGVTVESVRGALKRARAEFRAAYADA